MTPKRSSSTREPGNRAESPSSPGANPCPYVDLSGAQQVQAGGYGVGPHQFSSRQYAGQSEVPCAPAFHRDANPGLVRVRDGAD